MNMIRQASIKDLDSIEESYHEHFLYEIEHGAYTIFKEGVYPTRRDVELALNNETLYVYEENGIVLGSIVFDRQQPEEYRKINWSLQVDDEQVSIIHLLMVRPNVKGKGVGTALVNYVLGVAKDHHCIFVRLDTGEQNIPAIALYKKLGFQLVANSSMKVGGTIAHKKHLFFEKKL